MPAFGVFLLVALMRSRERREIGNRKRGQFMMEERKSLVEKWVLSCGGQWKNVSRMFPPEGSRGYTVAIGEFPDYNPRCLYV